MTQVSVVLSEAAARLSDPSKSFFTDEKLLVYLKMALGEFQSDLINNGSPFLKERGEFTLAGGVTTLNITGVVEVIEISQKEGERDYRKLTQVNYVDLNDDHDDNHTQWAWREGVVVVKMHPGELVLSVDFFKELFDLATLGPNTVLDFVNIRMYASTKTAALAAMYLARDTAYADRLEIQAEELKHKLINREVRARQSVPSRRQGLFRPRVLPYV